MRKALCSRPTKSKAEKAFVLCIMKLMGSSSEKAPGMFGTLVICLPSKHDGGDVHLTHSGQSRAFETAKSSEFDYSYIAWYVISSSCQLHWFRGKLALSLPQAYIYDS